MITKALRDLWRQVFGDTEEFLELFFGTAYDPARCRYTLVQDRLAAMLYWFDCELDGRKIAYLYAVATHPDLRGRGLCRELMDRVHRDLAQQGYDGCVLVPGEPGLFAMYKKMGYRVCSSIGEITCAAGTPAALRKISAAEYAALRRQYLPAGGVVQEGAALSLLGGYAGFYAGENCLCAAGEKMVYELLGDIAQAPGVAAALGLDGATVRTPGQDRPFAMYCPLTDTPAPNYFGLALD